MEKRSNSSYIHWVAEAALMLTLMLVVQLLTFVLPKSVPLISQLLTGSLVNLVLIVGSGSVGLAVVVVAAIISPLLAFLLGQMPFPQMIPVIAAGNLIIVIITWVSFQNRKKIKQNLIMDIMGIISGAVVKWLFLWNTTIWIMLPIFFANNPKAKNLAVMFSWPQLATALIGGALALFVLPSIRNFRKVR